MARFYVAVPAAAVVTFFLFFGMQALIALREGEVDPAPGGKLVGFVRVKREAAPPPEEPVKPDRPPPVDAPLSDMTPDAPRQGDLGSVGVSVSAPTMDAPKLVRGGLGSIGGDRGVTPLLRVKPRYPPRLVRDRVKGWVRLRFGVDTSGRTKNVRVIGSKPAVVFDEEAIRAVRKWKYQPKVVDGQPVERTGLTVRLRFEPPDE